MSAALRWIDTAMNVAGNRQQPGALGPEAVLEKARALQLDRVLVPLDGTVTAEYALPFAAMFGRWFGAETALFHCLRPMHPARGGRPGQVRYPDAHHDRGHSLASSYLEEVAARLAQHRLRVRWGVATGETAPMISARAATGRFGVIAMAARPHNRVRRRFQPGVLEELWKHTATPLLVLHEERMHLNGSAPPEPPNLIVPFLRGFEGAGAAPIVSALAGASGARVTLLRPARHGSRGALDGSEAGTEGASEEMKVAVEEISRFCPDVASEDVEGDPVEAILERQNREPGAWVVMESRMRSGLVRAVLGSRADQLVRYGTGPLLVVPTPGAAERRSQRAHNAALDMMQSS